MRFNILVHSVKFEADSVERQLADKTRKALVSAAKYLHKSARHAIRIAKTPSSPGRPPHSRKGVLKNAIASRVDLSRMVAEVGITQELGSKQSLAAIAAINEFGGTVPYSPICYKLGDYGPIAKRKASRRQTIGKAFRFTRLLSASQVERANAFAREFFGPVRTSARYPERPFLRPTLQSVIPVITKKFFS